MHFEAVQLVGDQSLHSSIPCRLTISVEFLQNAGKRDRSLAKFSNFTFQRRAFTRLPQSLDGWALMGFQGCDRLKLGAADDCTYHFPLTCKWGLKPDEIFLP